MNAPESRRRFKANRNVTVIFKSCLRLKYSYDYEQRWLNPKCTEPYLMRLIMYHSNHFVSNETALQSEKILQVLESSQGYISDSFVILQHSS